MAFNDPLSPNQILQFRQDLFRDLRMELVQLKGCQNQAILIALAGAGVMLGLIKEQKDPLPLYFPILFLLPLFILLPFWIIFFDKARTISRIVGFLMVQEKLALFNSDLGIIGWESAMQKYRTWKNILGDEYAKRKSELKEKNSEKNKKINEDRTLHNSVYWFTIYCVFFLFSVTCFALSISSIQSNSFFESFLVPLCVFFIFTFFIYLLLALIEDGTRKFTEIKIASVFLGFILLIICSIIGYLGVANQNFSLEFFYYFILVLFWILFITCASMALWFFKNLAGGRYHYNEFEWRWKKILEIEIDEKTKDVSIQKNNQME